MNPHGIERWTMPTARERTGRLLAVIGLEQTAGSRCPDGARERLAVQVGVSEQT